MRAFKYIRHPKAFEVIADETRRRIVHLLRARELTVSQIAEELQKTPQAVYHHIRPLLETGMVEIAREERVDNFIERYYAAAAEVFEFSYGEARSEAYVEQHVTEALQALGKLGIDVDVDKRIVSGLVDVLGKMETIGARPELEETIAKLEGVGFSSRQEITKYVKFLLMTGEQFEEWLTAHKEFRKLLRSTVRGTLNEPQHRT